MKKSLKIFYVLLITLIILTISSMVFATSYQPSDLNKQRTDVGVEGIINIGNDLVTILTTVGVVISVVVLIVLGIKYMMGSAEEKAEYKKTMMPYLVGAIFIFAASVIAQVIYNFAIKISAG